MKRLLDSLYYTLLPILALGATLWWLLTQNKSLKQQLAEAKAQEELKQLDTEAKEALKNVEDKKSQFMAHYTKFMDKYRKSTGKLPD